MAQRTIHFPAPSPRIRRLVSRRWTLVLVLPLVALMAVAVGIRPAAAAVPSVNLRTAASFAVLAGSTVTNTGPTVINGDLGVSPGTAVTGFPPGTLNGTLHSADAVALQAKNDLTAAYNDAAGRTGGTAVATELGGRTLVPGLYTGATLGITGTLTLDAKGDSSAVFIFQSKSTLITASASRVLLVNGANPCNVFWQVSSSATLGTNSVFVGTILAEASIAAQTGTTVNGRLLARTGAVTLDDNVITANNCAIATTTTTSTSSSTTSSSTTSSPTSTNTSPTSTATPELVPGAGAPHTGDTGTELPASPLNALLALGLCSGAAAIAMRLRRRTGRH